MNKNYVTATENMPHILKFKYYLKKSERVISFFFKYNLHSIIHNLSYLEISHEIILTINFIPSK